MPQAAFVLHRRDYQESSLLVDLLTEQDGRLRVIAKGAKRSKSSWRAILQAFTPLSVEFMGRHELKTLTLAEATGTPFPLSSHRLYSGFYLNELLQRLLPVQAEVNELFSAYRIVVQQLSQQRDIESLLRWFEWQLLTQLGTTFDWLHDADTGQPLQPAGYSYFDPEFGFLQTPHCLSTTAWPSEIIISLGQLDLLQQDLNPSQRKACKLIMREALAVHLGNKPLRSRELFRR